MQQPGLDKILPILKKSVRMPELTQANLEKQSCHPPLAIYRNYLMSIGHCILATPYGTSQRWDCPSCGGKNTLSITKERGEVRYNCFKYGNGCSIRGSRLLQMTTTEIQNELALRTSLEGRTEVKREFRLPDYCIPGIASKKAFQMLLNRNALEAYEQGMFKVAYDPRLDRLMYLIQDNDGKVCGAVGRALNYQKPKVYNYPHSKQIPFTCGKGQAVILVEDCASACSIARFKEYTGLALLGTEISSEYLFYIVANYTNIIIALDPDAYSKSFKLRERINYYTKNVLIWQLRKDLKNMTRQEIQELIQESKTPIII